VSWFNQLIHRCGLLTNSLAAVGLSADRPVYMFSASISNALRKRRVPSATQVMAVIMAHQGRTILD
jgi:hypothetical protein